MSRGRSQMAMELLLTVYAAVSAIIILRTVLVYLGVTDRVWLGAFIYRLTNPVMKVLELVPGASREVVLGLTLGDLTLLAPVVLFPLGLIAVGARER